MININCKAKSAIFKIIKTKQFNVRVELTRYGNYVALDYKNILVNSAYYNFDPLDWSEVNLSEEYPHFIWKNKDKISKEILQIEKEIKKTSKKAKAISRLENRFYTIDELYQWETVYSDQLPYFSPNDIEGVTKIGQSGVLLSPNEEVRRRSNEMKKWVIQFEGGYLKFDYVTGEYQKSSSCTFIGQKTPVEVPNWYEWGYNNGYNDGAWNADPNDPSITPHFPSEYVKKAYMDGYAKGGHDAYMDS